MSRLYIANVSRQTQIVCYRLDYAKDGSLKDTNRRFEPAKQQDIPSGKQVQIGGDFHITQIEDIVSQLGKYGLISVKDVAHLRSRGKPVPYIFNVDQPVSADIMRRVVNYNQGVQIEEGRERRQKAAVATNELVQNTVANQFAENGIQADPSTDTEFTIEQLEQSEAGEKRIEEGYRVSENAPMKPVQGKVVTKGNRRKTK
jgi:hypothetical protein